MSNPAREAAALVELALCPPSMGMGGGSAMEARAQDRWRENAVRELRRMRGEYGPPSANPELFLILDAVGAILRAD